MIRGPREADTAAAGEAGEKQRVEQTRTAAAAWERGMSSSAGSELMTELRPLSEEMKIEAHLVELEAMGYTIGARRCMRAAG